MNNKFWLLLIGIVLLIIFGTIYWWPQPEKSVVDFLSCRQANYPIFNSFPRYCLSPDGKKFIEPINEEELNNMPVIYSPDTAKPLVSPLKIDGEARGYWYQDNKFIIALWDKDGQLISSSTANAKNKITDNELVPFSSQLIFSATTSNPTGWLTFIPLHQAIKFPAKWQIPILLTDPNFQTKTKLDENNQPPNEPEEQPLTCLPSGCSGTVCVPAGQEVITTCDYQPQYACYQKALCQRQSDGACGWTETEDFKQCLAELTNH